MDFIPAAIFVRVSSKAQDYERQISDLSTYAIKHNYKIEAVIEEVVSGYKTKLENRPAVKQLLELAQAGKIKKILVSEISRLGRRPSEVLKIIEDLTALKVSVFVYNHSLETLTAKGERNSITGLVFSLLAEFARMEAETLGERIRSGKAESRRKGINQGRRKGTTKDLLKEYPAIVKDLSSGLSIRKTAAFRKVSSDTVRRVKKQLDLRK